MPDRKKVTPEDIDKVIQTIDDAANWAADVVYWNVPIKDRNELVGSVHFGASMMKDALLKAKEGLSESDIGRLNSLLRKMFEQTTSGAIAAYPTPFRRFKQRYKRKLPSTTFLWDPERRKWDIEEATKRELSSALEKIRSAQDVIDHIVSLFRDKKGRDISYREVEVSIIEQLERVVKVWLASAVRALQGPPKRESFVTLAKLGKLMGREFPV